MEVDTSRPAIVLTGEQVRAITGRVPVLDSSQVGKRFLYYEAPAPPDIVERRARILAAIRAARAQSEQSVVAGARAGIPRDVAGRRALIQQAMLAERARRDAQQALPGRQNAAPGTQELFGSARSDPQTGTELQRGQSGPAALDPPNVNKDLGGGNFGL
jgi:hypothetical protein